MRFFSFDYRLAGRRETLTLGQYDEFQASQPKRDTGAIKYGDPLSLADARELLARAKNTVNRGQSPAQEASAIATFKPRERALTPHEIRAFFAVLDTIGTLPTLKLAIKFILLTMCRKGELLLATWREVDFEAAIWTIPAERMKPCRPHVVYLSQQAIDLLVGLKTCAGSSPGRYETDKPMSDATLNRVITAAVEKTQKEGLDLAHFCVHDPSIDHIGPGSQLEHCPHCGGALKIIAAIEEPAVIARILTHLGLSPRPPPRTPARRFDLFQAA